MSRQTFRSNRRFIPQVACLEERSVPATVVWDGQANDKQWGTATNWSSDKLPTPSDDVVIGSGFGTINIGLSVSIISIDCQSALKINSGIINISVASTISGLDFSSGTLDGFGNVTVSSSFNWSSGTMTGGSGKLILAAGAIGTASGNAGRQLGRTLEVAGTLTYSGSNWTFGTGTPGTLSVLPGGTFAAIGDGDFGNSGPGGAIVNAGTFTRSGLGTTSLGGSTSLSSSGQLNVASGTLQLNGGGSLSAGATLSAGAALEVASGSFALNAGAAISGAGSLAITGGSLVVSANATAANYSQFGGTLDGGATLTVTGTMDWSGGTMTGGTGKLVLAAGATGTATGNSGRQLGRTLEVAGTFTYSGTNWTFGSGTAGTLSVQPGGTFAAVGDGDFGNNGPGGVIVNAGTFTRSGLGSTLLGGSVSLTNTGKLSIDAGSVFVSGGFTNFNGSSIIGGSYVLTGFLQFNAAKISTLSVPLTLIGPGSGIVDQNGSDALASLANVSNMGNLVLLNGGLLTSTALTNNGSIVVDGASSLTLSGAYIQNSGSTIVNGKLTATSGATISGGAFTGVGSVQASVNNVMGTVAPGSPLGKLTAGNYTQSGNLGLEINGTVAGVSYDQLAVQGVVTLGGTVTPTIGFSAKVGDVFTVIDNDGTDSVDGTFNSLAEGDSLTAQGYELQVSYLGGSGNDVTLKVTTVPLPPATFSTLAINDGSAQRSRLTSLHVTFSQIVSLPANPADAFQLKRQLGDIPVNLSAVHAGNAVTISFVSGPMDFGSLADGRYTLTMIASKINMGNFDGNGDGMPGDDFSLVGTPANGLFRLFGDADGDGTVAANDFIQFRLALGGSNPIFDFDGDGAVAASDFIQFRLRFGGSI